MPCSARSVSSAAASQAASRSRRRGPSSSGSWTGRSSGSSRIPTWRPRARRWTAGRRAAGSVPPPMRRLGLAALVPVLIGLSASPAGAANRWIQKRAPLNIAHQGGEDEFPSNTLYAFRKATGVGADMLELDIGVTRDDKVVVMHDTTVDGTTNGRGTVSSKTLAQIERLDAAYW